MLKIYGDPNSRAGRVVWCAREVLLDYEIVPVDFAHGEHKQPAYLAINPMGQVPAIVHGDFSMAESLAIPLYLALQAASDIAPRTAQEFGRFAQWSLCAVSSIEPQLIHIIANRMALPFNYRREPLAQRALQHLAPAFAAINDVVASEGWIAASRFTVADLNIASVLAPLVAAQTDFSGTPALETWLSKCLSRPAAAGQTGTIQFPPPIVARYLSENT